MSTSRRKLIQFGEPVRKSPSPPPAPPASPLTAEIASTPTISKKPKKLVSFGSGCAYRKSPSPIQNTCSILRNMLQDSVPLVTPNSTATTLIPLYLSALAVEDDSADALLHNFIEQYAANDAPKEIMVNALLASLRLIPREEFPLLINMIANAATMVIDGKIVEKFPMAVAEYIAENINYLDSISRRSNVISEYMNSQRNGTNQKNAKYVFDKFMYNFYLSTNKEQQDITRLIIKNIVEVGRHEMHHLKKINDFCVEWNADIKTIQRFPEAIIRTLKTALAKHESYIEKQLLDKALPRMLFNRK
jgi:hypothetical protein